jgi:hypothetical protein
MIITSLHFAFTVIQLLYSTSFAGNTISTVDYNARRVYSSIAEENFQCNPYTFTKSVDKIPEYVRFGKMDLINCLLERRQGHYKKFDQLVRLVIMGASKYGKWIIINDLLKNQKYHKWIKSMSGLMVHHAIESGHSAFIEQMLIQESRMDNIFRIDKHTANAILKYACNSGYEILINRLMQLTNVRDSLNLNDCLVLASQKDYDFIVKFLLQKTKVEPTKKHNQAFYVASTAKSERVLKVLDQDERVQKYNQLNPIDHTRREVARYEPPVKTVDLPKIYQWLIAIVAAICSDAGEKLKTLFSKLSTAMSEFGNNFKEFFRKWMSAGGMKMLIHILHQIADHGSRILTAIPKIILSLIIMSPKPLKRKYIGDEVPPLIMEHRIVHERGVSKTGHHFKLAYNYYAQLVLCNILITDSIE